MRKIKTKTKKLKYTELHTVLHGLAYIQHKIKVYRDLNFTAFSTKVDKKLNMIDTYLENSIQKLGTECLQVLISKKTALDHAKKYKKQMEDTRLELKENGHFKGDYKIYAIHIYDFDFYRDLYIAHKVVESRLSHVADKDIVKYIKNALGRTGSFVRLFGDDLYCGSELKEEKQ